MQASERGIAFFWSQVDKSGDCWLWTGKRTPTNYGAAYMQFERSNVSGAHRVAYTLANGPIPQGLIICHRCDNPPCVRPEHLYAGTHADNAADRMERGHGPGYIAIPEGYVTSTEAARILGIPFAWLARIKNAGLLQGYRAPLDSRPSLIRLADIENLDTAALFAETKRRENERYYRNRGDIPAA